MFTGAVGSEESHCRRVDACSAIGGRTEEPLSAAEATIKASTAALHIRIDFVAC